MVMTTVAYSIPKFQVLFNKPEYHLMNALLPEENELPQLGHPIKRNDDNILHS